MYDFWKPVLAFFKTNLSNRFISKDGLPNIFFQSHLIDFSNSLNSAKCSQWFAFEFKLNLKLGPSLKQIYPVCFVLLLLCVVINYCDFSCHIIWRSTSKKTFKILLKCEYSTKSFNFEDLFFCRFPVENNDKNCCTNYCELTSLQINKKIVTHLHFNGTL